jgi:putative endonuclease
VNPSNWFVYIIETKSKFLYTGIAKDVEKRLHQHQQGKGAKFFRVDPAERIVYTEACPSRGEALKKEGRIKKLSALQKRKLITV